MPRYAYAGPEPRPDDDNCIVRPGEIREMDAPPDWGPWAEVPDESGAAPEPAPSPPAATSKAAATSKTAPAETPSKGEGESK